MEFQAGSAGIQIQKIVDVLETEGESEWARRIDEAYYSHFGLDAVRAALAQLRRLQADSEVIDRLELRDKVSKVVNALALGAGEEMPDAELTGNVHVARELLGSIAGKEDEEVKPLGAASAGARQLLETLRNEKP